MKVIIPISEAIIEKWNMQRHIHTKSYKPIIYLKSMEVDEGVLLLNNMTSELILITKKEYDSFINGNLEEYNRKLHHFMITHWFMIPEFYDERTMITLFNESFISRKYLGRYIDTFTIFTTTDCNARCFYCYEKGVRKTTMTEQTAHDIAKYIIKHADPDKSLRLAWFGGEPLYNSNVIDIICNDLKDAGVRYYSTMISNGYLFDEDLVAKAKDIWNLNRVQITIDGTQEMYNKVKAYIYKDDKDPFARIIRNIKLLTDKEITVCIRMNITGENIEDMYSVVDVLYDNFAGSNYLEAYASPLFENMDNNLLVRTAEERKSVYEKVFKLEEYTISKNLYIKMHINHIPSSKYYVIGHCMVDNPKSCIISPEGKIGSCEHNPDSDFYGTIYNHRLDRDYKNIKSWKYINQEIDDCKSCSYYPRCRRHVGCSIEILCDENIQKEYDLKLEHQILNTFKKYKENPKNLEMINDFVKRHLND